MSRVGMLALLLLGCGGTESNPPGVTPVYELVEEWRVVSNDSAPGTRLSTIQAGAVLSDGRLLITLWRESSVRVFRPDGRFVTAFSRRGDGPGEMLAPWRIGFIGDTIWVFDVGRYVLFDNQYRYIGQSARLEALSQAWAGALGMTSGALSLAYPLWFGRGPPTDLVLYDFKGALSKQVLFDTVAGQKMHVFDMSAAKADLVAGDEPVGGNVPWPSPVTSYRQVKVAPAGAFAYSLEPAALFDGPPGQLTIRRIAFPSGEASPPTVVTLPPRPVTEADRRIILDTIGDMSVRVRAAYAAGARFPEYYPAFQSFDVALDGAIWLQEYMNDGSRLVISPNGKPLMRVKLPSGLRVLGQNKTSVWGALNGPDDVPILVKYRIAKSN